MMALGMAAISPMRSSFSQATATTPRISSDFTLCSATLPPEATAICTPYFSESSMRFFTVHLPHRLHSPKSREFWGQGIGASPYTNYFVSGLNPDMPSFWYMEDQDLFAKRIGTFLDR